MDRLRWEFGTLFDRLWNSWMTPYQQDFEPMRMWDFDVRENNQEIVVRAEMPGFDENELDVQLNENQLTIQAEKEQKGEREREYRRFYRTITLPAGIDADQVQANYHNGVLELHIPRTEGARARRIPVQGSQTSGGQQGQQVVSNQQQQTKPNHGQQAETTQAPAASGKSRK
jgi:HSP20 family protein